MSIVQNFRDTVVKASLQAGKPVIDERNLNQILFSLPQLYELNQGLLRELEDRVAHWYPVVLPNSTDNYNLDFAIIWII